MTSELVRLHEADGIATLTVDRQKALNALNADVLSALESTLDGLAQRRSLRALIITGAGEKAFVAGADIAAMADMSVTQAREFSGFGQRVFSKLEDLPVPTLAAVNGFALGGGLELALACDLILASENAKFGQPEVNLGLIPGFGGCVRLARRIGGQAAASLIYTGDTIDAARAKALGLVLEVLPQASLLGEAQKLAAKIASRGPVAVRAAKRVLNLSHDMGRDAALSLERDAFAGVFSSADQKEGCRAFLDKRAASFRGE